MSRGPKKKPAPFELETDEALMLRARGEPEAFGALVERHQATVLNFVHRFLGISPDVEDICSEVFLRIYRSRASYAPTARFTTFLYRATLNLCLNHLRSRKLRKALPLDGQPNDEAPAAGLPDRSTPGPDEALDAADRARIVREAVDGLPESQRTAVLLLRWEEMTYNEIADVMGLSIMAVKSLLSRAKENLRTALAEKILGDEAQYGG